MVMQSRQLSVRQIAQFYRLPVIRPSFRTPEPTQLRYCWKSSLKKSRAKKFHRGGEHNLIVGMSVVNERRTSEFRFVKNRYPVNAFSLTTLWRADIFCRTHWKLKKIPQFSSALLLTTEKRNRNICHVAYVTEVLLHCY